MAFDWSTVAGPSHIPLTPPSQEQTLSQIIGDVPFPSTSHGGPPSFPPLARPSSSSAIPSTPFCNHGSRRLDRSPRTPATRESITKHARISVSTSPPSQHIQNLPVGSVFDDTNEHTTYQHRRRHISNSPTRPSPHLTPGLSTIFHNLNMESDNDDDPIPLQTTPLFPSHHPPSRQINGWSILDIDERFLIYVVVKHIQTGLAKGGAPKIDTGYQNNSSAEITKVVITVLQLNVPNRVTHETEMDQLRAAASDGNEPVVLTMPIIRGTPINKYSGLQIAIEAFPTLFPTGRADFAVSRDINVTMSEWAAHLL
ncbi:hypothetical protein F5876DRAFT_82694 [Lentinula aff. lateritia]|uniref:Uncharacterized protein n=1 Tax=Lentinula aff. lateritia TaxID=2804960 RepID=A0ACC1TJ61_9AGAR|nr:hypothetical protein F5876DRAFT_82694 [Lentinula aff. lateritia]